MDSTATRTKIGGTGIYRWDILQIGSAYFKKTKYQPHLKEMWCIPPKQNAEFVANMEDVLEVYARAYDETLPVICMDEKPFQLIGDSTAPLKMSQSNHKEKYDCEYDRKGTCSIFMFTEPLSGWRSAIARPRRTCEDWADMIKWLLDACYYDAKKVVLVMDNLNTHTIASLYKRFSPEEAFRLSQRLQIHKTPKHGSWLNIAELELSALTTQCLSDRRIATIEFLNCEMSAWHNSRNRLQKGVSWHFSSLDARIKLKHLYPLVEF